MAKKIVGYVKLHIPAGKATPAPPVGSDAAKASTDGGTAPDMMG